MKTENNNMSIEATFMKNAFIDYADNIEFDGPSHRIEILNEMFQAWLEKELKEMNDTGGDTLQMKSITKNAWYYLKTIELSVRLHEDIQFIKVRYPKLLKTDAQETELKKFAH